MLITFANSFEQTQAQNISGLIWMQTIWHSDGFQEKNISKKMIWKEACEITQHANSLEYLPAHVGRTSFW